MTTDQTIDSIGFDNAMVEVNIPSLFIGALSVSHSDSPTC